MSRTLDVNYVQKHIAVLNIQRPFSVACDADNGNFLIMHDGTQKRPSCINCIDPKCKNMFALDIDSSVFPEMSHDPNRAVCPVNAIHSDADSIVIDDACIGCGLCAERCPFGAIYIQDGKAHVSVGDQDICRMFPVNNNTKKIQKDFLKKHFPSYKAGILIAETDSVMQDIYQKIRQLNQYNQNLLVRNLLICNGSQAALSRHGNVYMRMDGFYCTGDQYGVVEIETGLDMLQVSRALLDDVAVLQSRYGISMESNHPLAVCLGMANKRTDYWQVIKDIRIVTGLSINTVTIGMLLLTLWNLEEISDYDRFYIDVDDPSNRKEMETLIERQIQISDGFLGVLECGK